MILEDTNEQLHEVGFINPQLPGNHFLSITFTEADKTEFMHSSWKRVSSFEDACRLYLSMIV